MVRSPHTKHPPGTPHHPKLRTSKKLMRAFATLLLLVAVQACKSPHPQQKDFQDYPYKGYTTLTVPSNGFREGTVFVRTSHGDIRMRRLQSEATNDAIEYPEYNGTARHSVLASLIGRALSAGVSAVSSGE